jgi:hypothetical protein
MTTIDYNSINKFIIDYINNDDFKGDTGNYDESIDNIEIDYSLIDKYIQDYINDNIIQFIPILSNTDNEIINNIITDAVYTYMDNNIHNILFNILNYYEQYSIFQ